jgi:T5SS/PEP-CTERM-associated repeat protein
MSANREGNRTQREGLGSRENVGTVHCGHRAATSIALFALALATSPLASAAISTTGNVNPDPTGGTVSGTLVVGNAIPGTLAVEGGSTLTANTLSVGTGGTGGGTVTITGTASGPQTTLNLLGPPNLATVNNPLELGQWGTGTMTVSGGAIVNALGDANCTSAHCNTFIGQTAGSTGTLSLIGAGTTASFGGGFILGSAFVSTVANGGFNFGTPGGTATAIVNVTGGAVLNTYAASLANVPVSAASLGTEKAIAHVTVDGTGSIWTVSPNPVTGANAGINMASAPNATATIDVTHGGQLVITGANSYLNVGDAGSGTLTIGGAGAGNFGQVSLAGGMTLGNQATGVGTVTIGAGSGQSTLTAGFLTVGNSGTALSTFTVNAGGVFNQTADNFGVAIGQQSGSKGAVVINGGQFNVNGLNSAIGVGNNGTGSLTVSNGGQLTLSSTSGGIGVAGGVGSTGDVTVDGGQISVNGPNAFFGVGGSGTGTLAIINGGTVSVANLGLGTQTTGVGTATVGNGSGQSVLTVTNGMGVGNASTANSQLTVNSGGTVNVTGPNGLAIANSAGSRGSVLVDGGQLNITSGLGVGNSGTGTLTIQNGGQVTAANVGLGGTANALGTVTVGNGNGQSVLTVTNSMGVGNSSTGNSQLIVNSGGTVNVTGANGLGIAGSQGSQGSVLVDAGQLNVTGPNAFLGVGNGGTGSLTVINGGTVNAVNLGLGNQTTAVGTMTVGNGNGQSVVTVSNSIGIGNSSIGTSQLTVNSGGSVNVTDSAGSINVGSQQGSNGAVLVDGGTLSLTGVNSFAGIGNNGTGALTIQNGGSVTASVLHIGNQTNGVGTVVVGNGSGTSTLTVTKGLAVGNQGTGTLTVQSGGQVSVDVLAVANQGATSAGTVVVGNGGALTAATSIGVGNNGNGALTIQNGGVIMLTGANGSMGIGNSAGSSGTVLIDGGQLTVSGASSSIGIGNNGTGSFTVQNGGQVTMTGQNFGITAGSNGSGTLNVTSGSSVTTEQLVVAGGPGSTGVVSIVGTTSGPQTVVTLNGPANTINGTNPLAVGNWGNGTMTVSNGAIVNVAIGNANCGVVFCGVGVGVFAGSTGHLTLTDPGTTINAATNFILGNAAVSTNPPSNFAFGTPGGTTNATLEVLNGATLNTYAATVSTGPSGPNTDGSEHTIAHIVIDGPGSAWNVASDPVNPNNAQAFIGVAPRANSTALIEITNGGHLNVTGSGVNPQPQMNLTGGGQAGGSSTVKVDGAGSAIVFNGDSGLIQVGRNGGTAELDITNGGQVYGGGANGLTTMNVGRVGSNATVTVNGAGSSLTLSGVLSAGNGNGAGAAMIVGRDAGGGVGAVTVSNGGSILISDGGQNATASGVGMLLGRDAGSSGSLTVSGASSTLTIEQTSAGSTATPGMTIGQSGSGTVEVTAGGAITISNAGTGGGGITIARNAGSTGSLTVSGAGSSLTVTNTGGGTVFPGITVGRAGDGQMVVTDHATVAVNGLSERDVTVGNAAGGTGTLTVSNGAQLTASWIGVGNNGGTGTATIDNASVLLNGFAVNPDSTTFGASVRVGRGTGSVGTLNLVNGAQLTINTATADASINLGGTGVAPGGNGTLNMSGGSSISFVGSGATPSVNIGHSGDGVFTMTGASTLNMPNDGAIVLGNRASGNGTLQADGGSSINAGQMIVGNNGFGSVTTTGSTVTLHDTDVNGAALAVGSNSGSFGSFSQSGGTVAVSGNVVIGDAGSGTFFQDGGTHTIGGALVLGNQATGDGTYTASNGASVVLTGSSAPAQVVVGNQGTGSLTLDGGSTLSLPGNGSVVVGATASGVGTVLVTGGSSIQAGSLFGIGHDGNASTGGQATVIVDDPASSITAGTVAIGAGGCLAGNGVVHGNVVMDGPSANFGGCPPAPSAPLLEQPFGPVQYGFINPGRSPGRLVIDGGFDFISGTILLEVEYDPLLNTFVTDELVFAAGNQLDLADANIVFSFLGPTDPNAFFATGDWNLDTFFKTTSDPLFLPGSDQNISAILGPGETLGDLFASATFDATSPLYNFEEFSFTPDSGAISVDAVPKPSVPEPGTASLAVLALLVLAVARRYSRVTRVRG